MLQKKAINPVWITVIHVQQFQLGYQTSFHSISSQIGKGKKVKEVNKESFFIIYKQLLPLAILLKLMLLFTGVLAHTCKKFAIQLLVKQNVKDIKILYSRWKVHKDYLIKLTLNNVKPELHQTTSTSITPIATKISNVSAHSGTCPFCPLCTWCGCILSPSYTIQSIEVPE